MSVSSCIRLFVVLGMLPTVGGFAAESTRSKGIQTLLAALNLDRPGLEKVKAAQNDPAAAARELLAYYRARTSVKHPADRARSADVRGKFADKRCLEIADDAVKNILITCPHYPRFDFGPDIDWFTNRNPKRDKEWLWQLHRQSSWGALGRAYRHTGDEKYARAYVRQLLDWLKKCPCRKGSPAWRTIEAGIRGFSWTTHFQYFLDSPAFTPEVLTAFLNGCREHAVYLTSRKFSRNNWGLMEAEGAAFIGFTFPEFKEAAAWRAKAIKHLNAEIRKQVRADGMQVEQCLGYHSGCIHWFARTAEIAKLNGGENEFPPEYFRRLEAMCAVFLKLGLPDGGNTQFGDDHSQFHWRRVLERWAPVFNRGDFLYVATGGKKSTPPKETAFALKDSGFYSMRSGWDENAVCLVLKCGPNGGWHCQPDNGTFEIFAGGRRLTPDSGSYIYSGDAAGRAWFRRTRVHQTMTLDGKDIAYRPKLRLWKPGGDLDVLVVENQSYPHFTHRRTVLFVKKKYFVVVDEALGTAKGAAMLHFQLAPGDAILDKKRFRAHTAFKDGTNLLVQTVARPGLKLVKEEGRVSFEYGKWKPRPAFRFELKKAAVPLRFITVLVPYTGEVPTVRVETVGSPPPGAEQMKLDATVSGETTRIGWALPAGKP